MTLAVDHERGLMAGLATGNLLGLAVEGHRRESLRSVFPDGTLDIRVEPGSADDDDLAQAILLCEAAAEGPLDIDDLALRLWDWFELNGVGIGILTMDVLVSYSGRSPNHFGSGRIEWPPDQGPRSPIGLPIRESSKGVWVQGNRNRAGNGALMRCAPLAIRWRDDPVALARNSIVSAVPTHWDPRCGWSCVIFNLALAAVLRGESPSVADLLAASEEAVAQSLPDLAEFEVDAAAPSSVREAVEAAGTAALSDIVFDGGNMGYTLLSLQAGLISLRAASDFESGVTKIIMEGGDTDTNGAIVGAALGARFGLAGIPRHWREQVDRVRHSRPTVESYSDALAAARG